MSRRVFMTGGTGFLGRSLVDRLLSDDDVEDVNCLIRNDADVPSFAASSRLRLTVGDVTQPESYAEQLATCDTVLHLAAATGNASKQ